MSNRTAEIEQYQANINQGLNKAHKRAEQQSLDLRTARLVIFSDHHKGVRDGADDFLPCERVYNAALGYYLESDYTLAVLGDVEELWECHPGPVIEEYPRTFDLEAEFQKAGRYWRFFGNHDDLWLSESAVKTYLESKFKAKLPVYESLRLMVNDGGTQLGEIFLVHGHQGTTFSDRWGQISRFFVRHIVRNIQRLTHIKSTTPATDFGLRHQHNHAMYNWAESQHQLVLIAGHTHRPVFASIDHVGKLEEELATLKASLAQALAAGDPTDSLAQQVANLRAELEYRKAQGGALPGSELGISELKPCYFNTGCCSFSDGDVTGIEIANGEIKLVRWPDAEDHLKSQVLEQADLRKVLQWSPLNLHWRV